MTTDVDDEEEPCVHEGVECEHNLDSRGDPECPCRCDECNPQNWEEV